MKARDKDELTSITSLGLGAPKTKQKKPAEKQTEEENARKKEVGGNEKKKPVHPRDGPEERDRAAATKKFYVCCSYNFF
jgi:hypothetical protein